MLRVIPTPSRADSVLRPSSLPCSGESRTPDGPARFVAGYRTDIQVDERLAMRAEEKRQCPRRSLHCRASLVNEAGTKDDVIIISAECTNVSSNGLFAILPMGYGLAIGQRRTFRLAVRECGPETGSENIVSQDGEIVRVELLLGEDGHSDQIGIGVRLFGPRAGLLPTSVLA